MDPIVIKPGDPLPDDPQLKASLAVSRAFQEEAARLLAEHGTAMGEAEASSCIFSGMLSAAANFALKHGYGASAASHFVRVGVHVRPVPPGAIPEFVTATQFVELANILLENHHADQVAFGLLNAVANMGESTGDRAGIVALIRAFVARMEDPEATAKARAMAAMCTRPTDTTLQ